MILNIYTVVTIFMAILTGILAIIVATMSLMTFMRWNKARTGESRTIEENRSYLLLLMAVVILTVKLPSWPFFYVTLQSYISHIPGAMCIFGVTQAQPYLSGIAQIFKPVVFFAIGSWLLLNGIDRTTESSPLFRRKFIFLSLISLLILMDSIIDLAYFTSFDIESEVSCCTIFFDLPERTTALLPLTILGEGYENYITSIYSLSNIILIAVITSFYFNISLRSLKQISLIIIFITGTILSLGNAFITTLAFFEVIAPELMELPHHHCIYCMWQYAPDSIFITALFIIGTFSINWAFVLYISGNHEETAVHLKDWLKNLYFLAIVCLVSSILMVFIHFFMNG